MIKHVGTINVRLPHIDPASLDRFKAVLEEVELVTLKLRNDFRYGKTDAFRLALDDHPMREGRP